MNPFVLVKQSVDKALKQVVTAEISLAGYTVELPKDLAHGDMATNAAMVVAPKVGMKPRELADKIAEELRNDSIFTSVEVAGPGFINFRFRPGVWQKLVGGILKCGTKYGSSDIGKGHKVNIEYVSANPTGPMHVGHARGAVVGDALAGIMQKAGFDVVKEYYINDAGSQVDVLARSAYLRYREALGEDIGSIPEGLYPGDYLKPVGAALAAKYGKDLLTISPPPAGGIKGGQNMELIKSFTLEAMMDLIRDDLKSLGVEHEVFFSEKALSEKNEVEEVLSKLEEDGLIYTGVLEPPKGMKPDDWEERPQTLFRATQFGDDVDRPLKKSDGAYTYFASDIAYHLDKMKRGFETLINVWGVDHGGYVKRMNAAVTALSHGKVKLKVLLTQLVNLTENGTPVKMSKRSGTFVTLREVVDEVGKDVVRFIMLTRRNDAPLDFDLAKVKEQSRDNPVFYVQYAHARVNSVLRNAAEVMPEVVEKSKSPVEDVMNLLTHPKELAIIRQLAHWPRIVEAAATGYEPHRIAFYLQEVAAEFHGFWNLGKEDVDLKFIVREDERLTTARLALIRAVQAVIASGLTCLGVKPVGEMR